MAPGQKTDTNGNGLKAWVGRVVAGITVAMVLGLVAWGFDAERRLTKREVCAAMEAHAQEGDHERLTGVLDAIRTEISSIAERLSRIEGRLNGRRVER